jgi:deazaflavin-dependent oxidoreductase (nitroreductase family)
MTMRAAVATGSSIEVRDDVPDPTPGPGQVLARTIVCGICGSDLHALAAPEEMAQLNQASGVANVVHPGDPYVLGHEYLPGVPMVVVTSVGVKPGKLRKNPVMRIEHGGVYLAVASQRGAPTHPLWYYNFKAHPLVELQDGAAKGDYVARELSGDERAQWRDRAVTVWPDYTEYQTRTERQIPLFVLEPAV